MFTGWQEDEVEKFRNKVLSNKALTMRTAKELNLNKEIPSLWKNIGKWIKILEKLSQVLNCETKSMDCAHP